MKHSYIILILLFFSTGSFAQKQGNKWYFGQYAALDFNSGTPVPILTGQLNTNEGCASIADKTTGNLLFYTDGTYAWDKTNNLMPNGSGMGGNASSTQSAVAIPKPGSDSLYYVFTVDDQAGINGDGDGGANLNIINMSLNGGLGNVTTLDQPLLTPTTEKLAATYACNDTDIWVIIHQWNTNNFYSYKVTKNGISAPVLSSTGIIHYDAGSGINAEAIGYMKISPNGKMLALACYFDLNTVQLFNFDNVTGKVSDPVMTDNNYPNLSGSDGPYGVSFSPDNSKLYISYLGTSAGQIFQYNLEAGDSTAIIASRTSVDSAVNYTLGAIQIGPDGKMYVARFNNTGVGVDSLDVITSPNALGGACNYVNDGLYLGGGSHQSIYGLPDLIENFLTPTYKTKLSYLNCNGQPDTLTLVDSSLTDAATFYWDFGDPLSGTSDTSTTKNPYHNFSSLGSYHVTLVLASSCKTDTIHATVTISVPPVITLIPSSSTICQGQHVALNASGAPSYQWSPLTGLNSYTDSDVIASPTITTTYIVTGLLNGCSASQQSVITVKPSPDLIFKPSTPAICIGDSITLNVTGGPSYHWNPSTGLNSNTDSIVIANPSITSTYSVYSTSTNGCSDTAQIVVTVNPYPVLTLIPTASTICQGRHIELNAKGALSYRWNPLTGLSSSVDSSVIANPSTTTTYTVVGSSKGCSDTGQVILTVKPSPDLILNPTSSSICNGNSVSLTVSGGPSYQWSPASGLNSTTDSTVIANPSITSTYSVYSTAGNGCSDTVQIIVIVNPIPVLTISPSSPLICSGQSILLQASGASLYYWNPSTGLSLTTGASVTANPIVATTYSIIGADTTGCADTTTISVNVGTESSSLFSNRVPDVCHPLEIQFINASANDSSDYWKFGDGSTSSVRSPLHNYSLPGYYTVTLITYSVSGCEDSSSVIDTVKTADVTAFIPSAFTPAANGINAIFHPNLLCESPSSYTLRIYDRWGMKLFESTSPDVGWDGKYNGKYESLGVYVYYLSFNCGTCTVIKKGDVTLVR